MSLKSEEWDYLAEGGAHILFKYLGVQSCFKEKVIRVAKESQDGKTDELCKEYYSLLANNYIGNEYENKMELVSVDQRFLEALATKIGQCNFRPSHRIERSIDTSRRSCLIMDNLIREFYQYAVEIKPKWGLNCYESRRCKFCRLQSTKKYPVGDYCPVLFFVGSAEELSASISSLFSNPRNQLRIYKHGKPVEPLHADSALQSSLLHILLTDPIISRLKACQERLFQQYQKHPLHFDISSKEYYMDLHAELDQGILGSPLTSFLASIAVEDSSLFISLDLGTSSKWDIKIIDLDVKLPTKLKGYIEEHDYLRN